MLFNSASFILGFLPVALLGFYALGILGMRKVAILWLSLASLFFYGWWDARYVTLLLVSIVMNFAIGRVLVRQSSKPLLVGGIALNLAVLGYYKYTGFLLAAVDDAFDLGLPVQQIVLPLAISFYTFQQIAFLSDAYEGLADEPSFINYCAFITFFPHLIAGPITHHKEIIPQFSEVRTLFPEPAMVAAGLTMFLIGLFKKVMIADSIAPYANPVFSAVAAHHPLSLLDAWGGAIAYTLQIYFDFSGYSDMAVGLGMLFAIRLPFNFDSPLKASCIIDYWARWHMTLTRFVTAYIYNPMTLYLIRKRTAAGRPMPKRGQMTAGVFVTLVAGPTILAFIIVGVWHGAGWQFAAFGVIHGFYLSANQGWRAYKRHRGWGGGPDRIALRSFSTLITLACVVVALVFFRAPDLGTALRMVEAMAGVSGANLFATPFLTVRQVEFTAVLLIIVWVFPNTQEWMRAFPTGLGDLRNPGWAERTVSSIATWKPNPAFALIVGVLGFFALTKAFSAAPTEFIYFTF